VDLSVDTDQGTSLDLTTARPIRANNASCFIGGMKKRSFDIDRATARNWLRMPNPHEKGNSDVVKPWLNGLDVTRGPRDKWIVDFGMSMTESAAAFYQAPFEYVARVVRPERAAVRNELEKARWWLHARPAPDLRHALARIKRSIATARVAKHGRFVWLQPGAAVDGQLVVTARADDTTFGIPHRRFHDSGHRACAPGSVLAVTRAAHPPAALKPIGSASRSPDSGRAATQVQSACAGRGSSGMTGA
jgi:hypothetical protein